MGSIADDQLRMIFTCCHPALAPESRVALTLRLVCGLRTAEIARAFLQPESTVAQRLSRAKARIRDAGIPLRVPPPQLLPERTPAVLACIYLVFTEGYFATSGPDAVRDELCDEAIRLGTLLCELMPGEPQARALLALMLLTDSRRAQRRGADGELVPLEEQDRRHWDRAKIRAGLSCLVTAAENAGAGKYLAQARIAAAHAVAPNWERTDWAAIVSAYDDLAADAWTCGRGGEPRRRHRFPGRPRGGARDPGRGGRPSSPREQPSGPGHPRGPVAPGSTATAKRHSTIARPWRGSATIRRRDSCDAASMR